MGEIQDRLSSKRISGIQPITREAYYVEPALPMESRAERTAAVLALRNSGQLDPPPNSSDLDWREQANCLASDPNIFFPEEDDNPAIAMAKAICGRCVVRQECLEDALSSRDEHTVRGEMTPRERRRLKRRNQRQARINNSSS